MTATGYARDTHQARAVHAPGGTRFSKGRAGVTDMR
jgi:hypothetical protein